MNISTVKVGGVEFGGGALAFMAGPCVIESRDGCLAIAKSLLEISRRTGAQLVFKASFDKANRTSISSFRGPGLEKGIEILREVKETTGLPIVTDIHEPHQAAPAAKVADILQIPAFLCRQTDLLIAAGETGAAVNVKKAQFLAPEDMANVIAKIESTGNKRIILTERGSSFGYHNLVADMRSLPIMRDFGYPVVFDATHSVQRPGGDGTCTGGDGKFAPLLARAAVAAGCDGVFMETHPNPPEALSDKANAIPLSDIEALWRKLAAIHDIVER
ncbi:MAG: 3-deoxy-8-phosphooctulonate synthase [Kiritimatiellae bacterium]|nr:3-deoxy-8-phosphooctulonate synthase [Kiritimatiellia bacterium]